MVVFRDKDGSLYTKEEIVYYSPKQGRICSIKKITYLGTMDDGPPDYSPPPIPSMMDEEQRMEHDKEVTISNITLCPKKKKIGQCILLKKVKNKKKIH